MCPTLAWYGGKTVWFTFISLSLSLIYIHTHTIHTLCTLCTLHTLHTYSTFPHPLYPPPPHPTIPPPQGLLPVRINRRTGKAFATRVQLTMGAMADSYYEYLLKTWLIMDKEDDMYRDMWIRAMDEMLDKLLFSTPGGELVYLGEIKHSMYGWGLGWVVGMVGMVGFVCVVLVFVGVLVCDVSGCVGVLMCVVPLPVASIPHLRYPHAHTPLSPPLHTHTLHHHPTDDVLLGKPTPHLSAHPPTSPVWRNCLALSQATLHWGS